MDSLKIEVHFQDALDTLRNHFTNVIFHPKTTQSPLEILGYLEGRNLEFDAIWICSLSSDQYPLRIINHPVLPLDFRKKFSMRRSEFSKLQMDGCNDIKKAYLNKFPDALEYVKRQRSFLIRNKCSGFF